MLMPIELAINHIRLRAYVVLWTLIRGNTRTTCRPPESIYDPIADRELTKTLIGAEHAPTMGRPPLKGVY
jgi:hypothetical protein